MKKIIVSVFVCLAFVVACVKGPTAGAYLTVISEQCVGCRKCATVCNADAIYIIGNKAVIDPSKCIQCLKCIDVCPEDAIH